MNKNIKTVFLVAGVIVLGYGIYTLVIPETQVSVGDVDLIKVQDNTKSYITIAIGFVFVLLGLIGGNKK